MKIVYKIELSGWKPIFNKNEMQQKINRNILGRRKKYVVFIKKDL